MKIKFRNISVAELIKNYHNDGEEGVYGYDNKLNIRPKYQREFVYTEDKQKAVISSIINDYPLSLMYWAENADGTYEVLDGQQRTISICNYCNGGFSIPLDFENGDNAATSYYFNNLPNTIKNKILNYRLSVYTCSGNDIEKLNWFRTINIAGEKLTDQELLNATYTGTWLSDAKLYFSKSNCKAYRLGSKYLKGNPIRQDYLETVLAWISNGNIADYMAKHQQDDDATELKQYFEDVTNWVDKNFKYRKEMLGLNWGGLYNDFKDKELDFNSLETEISKLMIDPDVTNKKGIYYYVLTRQERYLSVRAFDERQKREAYERQKGVCPHCGKTFKIEEMEADHITPWHAGGRTISENCQMLCKDCNRKKSGV